MLDLVAMNAPETEKRMSIAHLAEELHNCFLQGKTMRNAMKTHRRQASVLQSAPGKETQCATVQNGVYSATGRRVFGYVATVSNKLEIIVHAL